MPGFIETIENTLENCTGDIDYLKGNVFQKFVSTLTVRFETWINCTTTDTLIFYDPLKRTDDWLRDDTIGNRFQYFNVGDEINISSATTGANNGDYLISEKLNDAEIRLTDTMGAAVNLTQDLTESTAVIALNQDPLGFTYEYGLIENDEGTNFRSKVDGNDMKYEYSTSASYIPTSHSPMSAVGKLSWQIGDVSIKNLTTTGERDTFTYRYEIIHTFYIHPFYLHQHLLDVYDITNEAMRTNPVAPKYFLRNNCLKHVFRTRAYRSLQNPNVYQELVFDKHDGNTGWFDEEYNGGTAEYTASNLVYQDASANTLDALDLNNTTTVTFQIDEETAEIADYVCINFIALPETDDDYKNINSLMLDNYVWDRAIVQSGGGAVNGDNYGGAFQVFENFEVVAQVGYVDVSVDVNFGASAISKINTLSDKGYLIAAYVVGTGKTAQDANYTTVLIDVNRIKTYISDDVVVVDNDILFHDQNDNTTVQASPKIKVEDEIVVDSLVTLDRTNLDLQFDNISVQVIATDGTDTAILQQYDIDFSSLSEINDVRYINQTELTPFNVNTSEIRKEIKVYRSPSQDVSDVVAYRIQYPFLFRWEYWEQLIINTLPNDFLDTTQDFNGYNQDWIRLGALSGWSIKYRIVSTVDLNGQLSEITTDETLVEYDYLANADWQDEEILCYDGATALTYSSAPYIMTNKRTKVVANFTYVGGGFIDENDVYMVARIIPKENGTYIKNDSFSSVWNREGLGVFTSNDGSTAGAGKIVVTENAGIFTGTFYIDDTKLPVGVTDYTISVSINRDTQASALSDYGQVQIQDVKALEVIDFDPPTITKDENPFKECCLPIKVFAIVGDSDTYKNDFTGIIKALPLQYSCTLELEKFNETTLAWANAATLSGSSTYGTDYALGFEVKNNKNYIGYKLQWQEVLDNLGKGKYRVVFDCGGGDELYSEEYCLEEYNQDLVDRTVRIDYTWNSVIGSESQSKTRDFAGMDWNNQLRICNAMFYGRKGTFETESVRLQSGKDKSVQKKYRETYTLEITETPIEILKLLAYDVLMADDISICDYNSLNIDEFVDIKVEIDSGFEPNYEGSRPYPSIEFSFIDKYDNRRKLYS